MIYGVIHRAAGRSVALLRDEFMVASQVVTAEETFRFTDLGAGQYVIVVEGTQLRSQPVSVNGQDQSQLDLTLVLAESAIAGTVRNGAGRTVALIRDGAEVATQIVAADARYRFAGLTAGTYRVTIPGTQAISPAVPLDGIHTAIVDLVAPAADKPLAHYVLFGPPDRAGHARTSAAGRGLSAGICAGFRLQPGGGSQRQPGDDPGRAGCGQRAGRGRPGRRRHPRAAHHRHRRRGRRGAGRTCARAGKRFEPSNRLMDRQIALPLRRWLIPAALLLITALAAFLRFWQLDRIPPGFHYDEAFEALEAWRVLTRPGYHPIFFPGNFGVEPMFIYLTALAFPAVRRDAGGHARGRGADRHADGARALCAGP